jgi:hypothetical protein
MRISLFILLAALLAGCAKSAAPTADSTADSASNAPPPQADTSHYPVLVVDEGHNKETTNTPETYIFAPTQGLQLDASAYKFAYGTNNPIVPDFLAVCLNSTNLNTNSFKRKFPTLSKTCVIDRNALDPVRGDLFPGFHTGDHGLFVIGRIDRVIGHTREIDVAWSGKFEVK